MIDEEVSSSDHMSISTPPDYEILGCREKIQRMKIIYERISYVAVQLKSNKLREDAQAENDELLKQIDSNIKAIIKDQHGTRVDDLEEPLHQEFNTGNDDVSPVKEIIAVNERLFREDDFKRLRRQDIKDMLLLLVQERVEDLQLAVESYQKKINISRPDSYHSDLRKMTPYTAYHNIQGIIYQDDMNRNHGVLAKEKMDQTRQAESLGMINAIDKKLKDRRLMRNKMDSMHSTLSMYYDYDAHVKVELLVMMKNSQKHAEFDESDTYTLAGNPVKEILLKLNLPNHRILKDGHGGHFGGNDQQKKTQKGVPNEAYSHENWSQLVHEILSQLHDDDVGRNGSKNGTKLALLSMRARKLYQRTGRRLSIDEAVLLDMIKIEKIYWSDMVEEENSSKQGLSWHSQIS
ncbi:hypothetical protein Tco_0841073 [Tanacetum coccineum]|uniref:Uncharacterized protein n=1 Tax=Tanacetum coccineum TaxID=301880 RepID=A0ABQ5AWF0_9ASTR